jgi:hypothetical protein
MPPQCPTLCASAHDDLVGDVAQRGRGDETGDLWAIVVRWRNASIRRLARTELSLVGEIDRTERIDLLYEQRGTELWSGPGPGARRPGTQTGTANTPSKQSGTNSSTTSTRVGWRSAPSWTDGWSGSACRAPAARGRAARVLHVTQTFRGSGIGSRLSGELEQVAHGAGDSAMVVSAAPSAHTVRFYQGRGFELMPQPLPELFEREARGCAHAESALRLTHVQREPRTCGRHPDRVGELLGWSSDSHAADA